jgi:hypothetical protein
VDERTVAARRNPEPRSYVVGCCWGCEVSHLVSSSRRSLRYPHGAYTRRRSLLLPACAHSSLREANIAHSIHTHNTRKSANQNCAHATPNSQIRRERKPELCTRNRQLTNPKEPTHKQRRHNRWWVVVKSSREVGRVGIIKELWMPMGLKTGLNHIRRRHKVCSSFLANSRVLLC